MMNCQYELHSNNKLSISIGGTKKKCPRSVVEYWDLNKVTSYNLVNNDLSLNYEKDNEIEGSFELKKLSQ